VDAKKCETGICGKNVHKMEGYRKCGTTAKYRKKEHLRPTALLAE